MIDAILGIVDFLVSIVHLIGNTLASVAWVITSIPQFIGTFTGLLAYCPTYLVIWIECALALTVLFAVLKLMP